jgi:protein TonB
MQDARPRLLLAIVVSAALHLSLIYGITVRAPVPLAAPLIARLQREPPALGELRAPATQDASPIPASPPTLNPLPVTQGAPLARPQPTTLAPPAEEIPAPVPIPAPPPDSALPSVAMPLLADPTWYTAQQLDVYPRALAPARPAYPGQAAQQGLGGEVTLLLMVDERGSVEEVFVVQAAPEGYFEAAAVAAYRSARFEPAQKDGRRVRSRILVRVSFDPASISRDLQSNLSPRRHEDTKNGEGILEDEGPR